MKILLENWRQYLDQEKEFDVMYHAASPENRENIEKHGLKPGLEASYGPPAVYLFISDLFAENYITDVPLDVWKVDMKGLSTHPDPEDPSAARYYKGTIEPSRLTYTGTFLNGQLLSSENHNSEDSNL